MTKTWSLACLVAFAGCHAPAAAPCPPRELQTLQALPLHVFREQDVDVYLRWFAREPMSLERRVAHLARKTIGQPYRLSLLGEFPVELTDPDPTYCLAAADCVTFVEQTFALALSQDWTGFYKTLQRLRYRDGRIGYRTRNHFMESDWNPNNAWLLDDVTASLHPDAAMPMTTRVDRAAFLRRVGLSSDEPPQVVEGRYIPRDRLPLVADVLRESDVMQFVRPADGRHFVSHMGILLRDSAGRVTLIHAGQPAVAELPLEDYLAAHPAFAGFKILRLRPAQNHRRPD